ncbi:polysaccharide pyruvyl transferase family protein [Amnibacterium flavum]|uniref:Polysaccharide pyruvyl transferase family protein n=1 Tax=Amnibacterium flavum TaxID=2173173 RepID=A0A2V1HTM8_9MICO|nr:polysaccharide pyruvyl transferase family protein [Amnibacterium flavum]PVZ95918.1 polysaccharide pyruvyl transferase family protein [Amnibacterium flavum]
MATVELFHWNPDGPAFRGRIGRRLPFRKPLNNFGDLLGPIIVRELLARRGIEESAAVRDTTLLSVGSVLQFANDGDTVWGTGVNGKTLGETPKYRDLDVRAVRGPRTRSYLLDRGISVPEIYGDPGLLVAELWPREKLPASSRRGGVAIIPNLRDHSSTSRDRRVVDPRSDLWEVLAIIASSDLVVGSSLHGIIIAEAYGVPARLVKPTVEPPFKYDDYYAGTGRDDYRTASSVDEAIALGGERPPVWSSGPLLGAFPYDLWSNRA